jgi:hypothetical protein
MKKRGGRAVTRQTGKRNKRCPLCKGEGHNCWDDLDRSADSVREIARHANNHWNFVGALLKRAHMEISAPLQRIEAAGLRDKNTQLFECRDALEAWIAELAGLAGTETPVSGGIGGRFVGTKGPRVRAGK